MNYFKEEVSIVLLEVPTEISLIIPIAGCGKKCKGCHSPHHQDANGGEELTIDILATLLEDYKNKATCICFFNGENNPEELSKFLFFAKSKGFKTALYSGKNSLLEIDSSVLSALDFLKIGDYREKLGAIDSKTTNQRFFEIDEDGYYIDATRKFWRD